MRTTRFVAIAMAAFMLIMPLSIAVSAHETEGEPIIVTVPMVITEAMPCAVFFADNMVYAPQWRLGNPVRIETMIVNMTGYDEPEDVSAIDTDLIDLYNEEVVDVETGEFVTVYDGNEQQAAINANSDEILPLTRMVSVSYIKFTMTNESGYAISFDAGWNPVADDDPDTPDYEQVIFGGVGREVNQGGHLIYAMLWDTTNLGMGTYTVSVELGVAEYVNGEWIGVIGSWYSVGYAIAHHYVSEGELADPCHPYVDIVSDPTDPWYSDLGIGLGGVYGEVAWIELGDLIPQGSGGGNGDESGGSHGENGGGNGDHELGQNGVGVGRRR